MSTVDFDAVLAKLEAAKSETGQGPAPKFKIRGKTYDLAAKLPASLALLAVGGAPERMLEFFQAVFGKESCEEVLSLGLDIDQLGALVEQLLQAYGSGESPASRAPSNGGPSRRISKRSTASA